MNETTIFNDFLTTLEVPHTVEYSNKQFDSMAFKSLFGLSRLLLSYGIPGEAYRLADPDELEKLPVPFIAQQGCGFVIVRKIAAGEVTLMVDGADRQTSLSDFKNKWKGVVFLAYPNSESAEPHYGLHKRIEIADKSKKWVLIAALAFIVVSLFVMNGLWKQWSTVLLFLFDCAGLYVTYLLLLKSMNRKSSAADKFCGVIEAGGCNDVLASPAAKFFGLFGWSEVGFAYFGVSLLCLLVFPQWTNYLALINACCCPFSFWSIWYQKYRAKAWCTMCLTVQALLWLSLFTFILGGWFRDIFPLRIELFILGSSYVVALLSLNKLMPLLTKDPS